MTGHPVRRWTEAGLLAVAMAATMVLAPVVPGGPVARAQQGALEGQVLLSPKIASRRPRFRLYSEYGQAVVPPATRADSNEMANVVIYLQPAGGDAPAAPLASPLRIEQSNETFAPHVLAIPVGSTVDFPNKDPFFHNVFSLSRAKTFDLGRYAQGASKRVVFDRPGIVQVFCHIHSDMSAVVLVLANRFFGSPNSAGMYGIRDLPPGTYQVTAWHERAKPTTATVTIQAGKTTRLDFNIPITDVESQHR